jgi:hypothetical protein
MAFSAELFQPVPPSPYLMPSIVMGLKNVGAADVARATSYIFASKGSEVSEL